MTKSIQQILDERAGINRVRLFAFPADVRFSLAMDDRILHYGGKEIR